MNIIRIWPMIRDRVLYFALGLATGAIGMAFAL